MRADHVVSSSLALSVMSPQCWRFWLVVARSCHLPCLQQDAGRPVDGRHGHPLCQDVHVGEAGESLECHAHGRASLGTEQHGAAQYALTQVQRALVAEASARGRGQPIVARGAQVKGRAVHRQA
ncbi:MAG: hypothetical protein MUC99_10090, partial [Anaerolineae bacterium]|nr:hypothetical protein [Anaerolineae bacterium]